MTTSTLASIKPARLRAPCGGFVHEGRYFRGGSFLPQSARAGLEALAGEMAKATVGSPTTIGINGYSYRVESIIVSPSVGTVAFLVIPTSKPTESYHLHHNNQGETVCTCGDFVYRKAGTGVMCKHGQRLAELGLIPSSRPRILPPFAQRGECNAPALSPVAVGGVTTGNTLPTPWTPTPSVWTRFDPTPAEQAEAMALIGGGF